MLKKKMNQKGFTLVELIIVIAVLGLLMALFVPRIVGSVENAKKNTEVSNARTLAGEITTYNAMQKVNGQPVKFANSNPLQDSDLDDASLPPQLYVKAADFPDPAVVHIIVDSNGNATVDIQ